MASQSSKIEEIIDTTQDGDEREDDAPSDDDNDQEHDDATPQDSGSTPQASSQSQSKKKKKKAKSKAAKALRALTGGGSQIPQELVDHVLDQVKEEGAAGSADVTEENVRQVLKEMKIVEAVQGKAGIGGFNKKDMGEHKVRCPAISELLEILPSGSFGRLNLYLNLVSPGLIYL